MPFHKAKAKIVLRITTIALVCVLTLPGASSYAITDSSDSTLAPPLQLNNENFKRSLTVAAICKHVEHDGNLDDRSCLSDVLARLDAKKNSDITVLPYEIIIEIPNEGLAVRYFDPMKANVITPYSNISKLSTKVIGSRLNRQIIQRVKVFEYAIINDAGRSGLNISNLPETTSDIDVFKSTIVNKVRAALRDRPGEQIVIGISGLIGTGKTQYITKEISKTIAKNLGVSSSIIHGDRFRLRRVKQGQSLQSLYDNQTLTTTITMVKQGKIVGLKLYDQNLNKSIQLGQDEVVSIKRRCKNEIQLPPYENRLILLELDILKRFRDKYGHLLIDRDNGLAIDPTTGHLIEVINPTGKVVLFETANALSFQKLRDIYTSSIFVWATWKTRKNNLLAARERGERYSNHTDAEMNERFQGIQKIEDIEIFQLIKYADMIFVNDQSGIIKNATEYIYNSKELFKDILGENKPDALVRVPVEAIESVGIDNIKDFLATFQEAPNGYIELYHMSGIGEVSEAVYQKYGLQKKPLPKDFKRTRESTVTLFPALKGEEINQSVIVSRLGNFDVTPDNAILSPIGLQRDHAGLIRATILGLKMMDVARQIKEKGIGITKDQAFKDKIQLEILEQLKNICDVDDLKNFNLTPDDVIALATGTINNVITALKKLIKLLPITPIDANELRQLYEHAKMVITAA